jgi:hypothetical protein
MFELTSMAPGPELAGLLGSVDQTKIDGHERVVLLQGLSRQIAHYQALSYSVMVGVADAVAEEIGFEGVDFAADEIRAALAWTRRAAETQLNLAYDLERLPPVWKALHAGLIDLPKAKVIVYGLEGVKEEVAAKVAEAVIDKAPQQTTGQIAARLRRLIIQADPESAKDRYQTGLTGRRIECGANPDGTANLYGLSLPAERANSAMSRVNDLAQAVKTADDPRSLDQVRADVFLDLLHGNQIGDSGRRAIVDLQVDVATLAGLSENPGQIPGWGPVIADIARQVAAEQEDGEWRYTVTDPGTGEVVCNGTTRRRPSTAVKRRVQARRPTCVFPGCRMPAINSDLDHTKEWAQGGETSEENLGPLCRHDHMTRHHGGWRLKRTKNGAYIWTSPLGHTYTVQPQPP